MSAPPVPRVGQPAPEFSLRNQHGEQIELREQLARGPVLLVFYPFAWSSVCTGELCGIRDDAAGFTADGTAQVLAVSVDPMFTLRAWSDDQGFEFGLLSDFWPHGQVAQAYGVFDETAGMAIRGTFLIDPAGVVRWSQVNAPGQARDFAGYREALAAL